ncbi:hypothetical protein [Paenarthrobacter sp. AB444]|uniref:hypothetical protein n=1 Tax=Paenarthrobacter sp. AB444 TaxID=3025681 RepID=UPI0023671395|nr:hypothetical protein [Paenarthrobacter sp. AB444]MDD7835855.1 hypothetical protein [Paenarthrobacter sp. AB444]
MTFKDLERGKLVDELLLDADLGDAPDLRQALLAVGSFADAAAPEPGEELAAMLAGPHDDVSKRRWRHKHRTAVVGVAVVAAMGLGVTGVAAASSGFTRSPSFEGLWEGLASQRAAETPVLLTPDAPKVGTVPAPSADPAAIPLDVQQGQPVQPTRPVRPVQPAQPGPVAAGAPVPVTAMVPAAAPQPAPQNPGTAVVPAAPHAAAAAPVAAVPGPTPAAPKPAPLPQSQPAAPGLVLRPVAEQLPVGQLKAEVAKLKQAKKPVER